MNDGDLLDIATRTILTDRVTMDDINHCQTAGVDILTACRSMYGWSDPAARIARGDMNAVQFVQALHLARRQPSQG